MDKLASDTQGLSLGAAGGKSLSGASTGLLQAVRLSDSVLAFAQKQGISEQELRTRSIHIREPLDDTQVLAHYFINSSHNTYLVKGQLTGASKADRYKQVIQAGVRCVEIDAWDSPGEEEPVKVTHGFTLTSSIPFGRVCQAIADADLVDDNALPIVISLECHAKADGQLYMVKKMREIFGERLLDSRIQDKDRITLKDAANKILIKVEYCSKTAAITGKDEYTDSDSEHSSDDEETAALRKQKQRKSRIIDELQDMGVYTTSLKPKGDDFLVKSPAERAFNLVANISESALHDLLPKRHTDIIQHTQNYAMRVYPKGLRIMSRNLDPLPFWNAGAQIVALNFQTYDKGVQLNSALFHNSKGWVLKPKGLLQTATARQTERRLKVELYGANALVPPEDARKNGLRCYVKTQLCQKDEQTKETKAVKPSADNNKGADPVWDTSLHFEVSDAPLTFLRFEFIHQDGMFSRDDVFALAPLNLGKAQFDQWCLLPLTDLNGESTASTALIRLAYV